MKKLLYILFFLIPFFGFSQSSLKSDKKSTLHDVTVLQKMGESYFDDGKYKLSEQSYFAAKKKARGLGDLKLEVNNHR